MQTSPGTFAKKVVQVGARNDDWVRVDAGIAPGDLVVISGAFVLASELAKSELGDDD